MFAPSSVLMIEKHRTPEGDGNKDFKIDDSGVLLRNTEPRKGTETGQAHIQSSFNNTIEKHRTPEGDGNFAVIFRPSESTH